MTVTFRPATVEDDVALRDLERAANVAALGHIFSPEEHGFPDEAVLARWTAFLVVKAVEQVVPGAPPELRVDVDVVDDPAAAPGERARLICLAAYDEAMLRHLAVHPDHWGTGLARAAVGRAVTAIRGKGGTPRLWCLEENTRARGLYRHLGWEPTGVKRPTTWPGSPVEQEWVLVGAAS